MANLMANKAAFYRKGIDKIIKAYKDNKPEFFSELLGEEITDKQSFYRIYLEGDFGYAGVVNEMGSSTFDDQQTPYTMDITPLKRQIGWITSTESVEGDLYGLVARAVPKLKKALRNTMELAVANQFNNFTSTAAPYVVPDGLALISTAHTLHGGATAANRPASDIAFSALALERALQELRDQVSHRGIPNPEVGPFTLMVPNELLGVAKRVVKASGFAQTANNDPNALISETGIKVHANPWFTDANNWGLMNSAKADRNICLVRRRGVTMHQEYDIYKDAEVFTVNEIYQVFNKDWRGFWGTAVS